MKLKLRQKSFEVLSLLLERPGELVTREDLRNQLWSADVFVDFDNNLNAAVTALREALSDSADKPRYIETLPRRGYRFIAPLSEGSERTGLARRVRLAVLPFANLSAEPLYEYFSDGLTEELIGQLAGLAPDRLSVIARTSAMHYKGSRKDIARICRELDVDYALEGSVRRTDKRVRISAQLIQARDQSHIWTNSYESEIVDVLRLQTEVAHTVARQIDAKLVAVGRPGTRQAHARPEVYDLYIRGLYHLNKHNRNGFERAIECFENAVNLDTSYAPAHAKLAIAHAFSAFWGYVPPAQACPVAETTANRALDLNEELVDAHIALGFVHWFLHWDFAACRREYERAVQIGANDPTAHWHFGMFLGSMCEDPKAIIEVGIARELDPLSLTIRSMSAWVLYWLRQYDDAIEQSRCSLEIDENCLQAYYVLGHALIGKRQYQDAVDTFSQTLAKFGDPLSLGYLGMARGFAGDQGGAVDALRALERRVELSEYVPAVAFASVYLGMGDIQKALDWIEKVYAEHDAQVLWLRVSVVYESLRGEPRCERLIQKLGLPAVDPVGQHSHILRATN